jgi:hypothetical protein
VDAIPWADFVRAHAPLSREEFLAVVDVPHLLVPWLPVAEDADDPFFTTTLTRDQMQGETLRRGGVDLLAVAVRKREAGNAFAAMITLGRAANNDLVLPHAGISKFHAWFHRGDDDGWRLRDAGSLNGTRVDGVRLERDQDVPLRAGAIVRLADAVTCEFVTPAELFQRLQREQPLSSRARAAAGEAALPPGPADGGRATRVMPRRALDPDEETHPLAP